MEKVDLQHFLFFLSLTSAATTTSPRRQGNSLDQFTNERNKKLLIGGVPWQVDGMDGWWLMPIKLTISSLNFFTTLNWKVTFQEESSKRFFCLLDDVLKWKLYAQVGFWFQGSESMVLNDGRWPGCFQKFLVNKWYDSGSPKHLFILGQSSMQIESPVQYQHNVIIIMWTAIPCALDIAK